MLPGGAGPTLPQILIGWSTGYRWPLTDMKGLLLFLVAFKVSVGGEEEVESLQTVKLTGPECKQIQELQQIPSWHPGRNCFSVWREKQKQRIFILELFQWKACSALWPTYKKTNLYWRHILVGRTENILRIYHSQPADKSWPSTVSQCLFFISRKWRV